MREIRRNQSFKMTRCLLTVQKHLAPALLILISFVSLQAQASESTATNSIPDVPGVTLRLANRDICVFRDTLNGYSPEEREAAAEARLHSVLAQATTMLVTTQAVPTGIQISLDSKPLFVVTAGDVSSIRGETLESKVESVVSGLKDALQAISSLTSGEEVAKAIAEALFGIVLLYALIWLVRRGKVWLLARTIRLAAKRTVSIGSPELRNASLRSLAEFLRAVLNFTSYLLIAFIGYAFVWYELRRFPYSKPWGDYLRAQCGAILVSLGQKILSALPDLMTVVIIILAARMFTQVLSRAFFAAHRWKTHATLLNPATALTSRRILVFLIWLFAVIVAYPYIPGSRTLAFKGITVFVGLLFSLGSTNILSQFASGLVLIYSGIVHAGDYVRVGETEGTVLGVGLCATHIRTIKNEEVHIANSVLLGTATKNYSRLAGSKDLYLPVKVTISYSTPWRQVHAMLQEAARRTTGITRDPPPFVLQTNLSDFYVEYELNAGLEIPEQRVWVQSALNCNIQDVFNEHGVQIMSPHYLQDPPKPLVVPRSGWFAPPATNEAAAQKPSLQIKPSETVSRPG